MSVVNNKSYQEEGQPAEICHYLRKSKISCHGFIIEIFKVENVDCRTNPIKMAERPTLARKSINSLMDKEKTAKEFGVNTPFWKESLNVFISA